MAGRKAQAGTYESRDFIVSEKFGTWLKSAPVSADAHIRLEGALRFGLGVGNKTAEELAEEKAAKKAKLQKQLAELS